MLLAIMLIHRVCEEVPSEDHATRTVQSRLQAWTRSLAMHLCLCTGITNSYVILLIRKKQLTELQYLLITGGREEMFLGVLTIGRRDGKERAEACLSTLDDWSLWNRVHGLVLDTTASNTGLKKGTCTFTENSIEQKLAWVACRHPVMKLPRAAVFGKLFGPTDFAMFMRFQQSWPHLDLATY